jgi:hypothetical protein
VSRDACALDTGCPIRESRVQHLVGSYPWLIAASYALHRLPAPRHPPCALSNLTTIILVSLASAWPSRPCGAGYKNSPFESEGSVVSPQTPPLLLLAVDSYSPFCHYSLVNEPDIPADRRRRTSPPLGELRRVHSAGRPVSGMVEPMGVEPTTSWLQTRRSPN